MSDTAPEAPPRNPGLPAPVVALLYLLVCLLPLILAALRVTSPTVAWELAAAGAGLAGLAAMAVQFVTSGRFQIVSGRLGIDHVMAFHKTAAWWVLLALILHPVAYVVPTLQADPALAQERMMAYLTLPHYRSGVIALAALVLLVMTSVLRLRLGLRYEPGAPRIWSLPSSPCGPGCTMPSPSAGSARRGWSKLLVGRPVPRSRRFSPRFTGCAGRGFMPGPGGWPRSSARDRSVGA
jgi:Predicted ferric reductase